MEEIIFRAKRKDNGEWVCGFLIKMWGVLHIIDKDNENIAYEIIPETVGQFTGLTDESGKKIFEGDIVKTREFGKDSGFGVNFNGFDVFEVIYSSASFKLNNARRMFYLLNGQQIEVIGNIYDNKELLEEKR